MGERLLRLRQVQDKVGLGHSAIYARMASGTFPKPVPIGPANVRWLESEVDAWIAARKAERDRPAGDGDGDRKEAA